ncbi:MAG TPA: trehalose-phosphatase [Longimicrobiaceae bacterium]|nr:trehalose-phosphatase [Longimicrobiaceae bacterium]
MGMLPHALERVGDWAEAWRRTGRLVLLLDFDGTLAPIVARPELAAMPDTTRAALDRLMAMPGVEAAVVSGRGLADVRERAGISGIAYAGNHGMEIHGPGIDRIHPEAAAARPVLERAAAGLRAALEGIPGAWVEDKQLTLSVHHRQTPSERVPEVREIMHRVVAGLEGVHLTEGKQVIEVRPNVDWNKGRAVLFLLDQMQPPASAPILYFGDDRTDEDAFRALAEHSAGAEGVLVADDPPEHTAATSFVHTPAEVGEVFAALADAR